MMSEQKLNKALQVTSLFLVALMGVGCHKNIVRRIIEQKKLENGRAENKVESDKIWKEAAEKKKTQDSESNGKLSIGEQNLLLTGIVLSACPVSAGAEEGKSSLYQIKSISTEAPTLVISGFKLPSAETPKVIEGQTVDLKEGSDFSGMIVDEHGKKWKIIDVSLIFNRSNHTLVFFSLEGTAESMEAQGGEKVRIMGDFSAELESVSKP